jgi:hypothetical protein
VIEDRELKKGNTYRVKIIEHENKSFVNKSVEVTFTGILFRGKKEDNILYLHQIEVLEAIEKPS